MEDYLNTVGHGLEVPRESQLLAGKGLADSRTDWGRGTAGEHLVGVGAALCSLGRFHMQPSVLLIKAVLAD